MKGTIRTPKNWCLSQAVCSLFLIVLLSGLLPPLPANAANGSSSPGEGTPPVEVLGPASDAVAAIPLEDLLAADGTLHVPPGRRGSIDVRGWRMASDEIRGMPRFVPQADGDEQWWDGFYLNGLNGEVYALAVDGSGNLYAGGHFTHAGTVSANHVARWDPLTQTWNVLGGGMGGESWTTVNALAVDSSGNLYAGGDFTTAGGMVANYIARWDLITQTWSALGSGVDDRVYALVVDGSGNLYAGGEFFYAGDVNASGIARWDPLTQTWSVLGSGVNNGGVYALAVDGSGNLYAGGGFNTAGGVSANHIARWDPSTQTWSALGSGVSSGFYNTSVNALAFDDSGNLYAGGSFTAAGGVSANHIARWDLLTQTWSALGSGTGGWVFALAFDSSGNLYAGDNFTITRWDPITQTWSALGNGVNDRVEALAADDSGNLYVGGEFAIAGGEPAEFIALWDGAAWGALFGASGGQGVASKGIFALAFDGCGNLYAGGRFTTAGGVIANHIARWDPLTTTWSALGSGVNGSVYALAVDGSGNLYAGGDFYTAGGVSASRVARWDPITQTWSALGSGVDSVVDALAFDGSGNLYIGGWFTTAGGVSANYIARWDPLTQTWSALGSGISGDSYGIATVYALTVDSSGNLYAGGNFTAAGGVSANNIARWDPLTQAWSALGSGMNHWVETLAVDGSGNLYAGGFFTTAGGVSATYIARWDPLTQTWSALGSGISDGRYNMVDALAFDGSGNLYVGGIFTTAGGVSANNIARWEPLTQTWSALGSGIDYWGSALAIDGSRNLYAGGWFITAGGKASSRIARWVFFNTAPVANSNPYTTPVDTALVVAALGVLGNDRDAEGDPLTAVLDSGPAVGELTFNADGSFVYTPPPGFTGLVTFTYHASDGLADSASGTVAILVGLDWYRLWLPLLLK